MKTWLTLLTMAALAAIRLQQVSLPFESARATIRAEANADILSLKGDSRSFGYEAVFAPLWVRNQWVETQADLRSLRSDVNADARICSSALQRAARRVASVPKDQQ